MAKKKVDTSVMETELMGSMALTVPVVGELAQIESGMNVYGGDAGKDLITLDDQDRKELAALFIVKGGMAGLTKRAKEMEEKAREIGAPWMLARGVKKVRVDGIGTFSLSEGKSVTISGENLRKVLLKHGIPATKVNTIVTEATNTSTYTTLKFVAATVKK